MRKKIYVIDDSPSDLNSITKALEDNLDCDLAAFQSAEEAIQKITDVPPDLVVVDTLLPDTDGFEVSSAIRKVHSSERVKIIMVTKYIDAVDAVSARAAGADDYAPKTSDSLAIVEAVKKNLNL